jgi:hypothetical protein
MFALLRRPHSRPSKLLLSSVHYPMRVSTSFQDLPMPQPFKVVALLSAIALAGCSTDAVVAPETAVAVTNHVSHFLQDGSLAPHTIAPAHFQSPIALSANGGVPAALSQNAAAAAATQPDILYWGGGIVPTQKIAVIYYSAQRIYTNGPRPGSVGSGAADGSLIGHFLNNIGGTPYWNINSTYYQDGANGRTFVQNSMQYTSFWAPNKKAPHEDDVVTPDDMVGLIETGFANGSLQYDPNTLYMIMTGSGVNLGGGFSNNNLQYCAFHSGYWFNDGGPIVQFAAMPYDADFNTQHPSHAGYICTYLTRGPNGDLGADATVSAMIHETEETATDPVSLTTPPYFAGWYDVQGEENADKCAYTYGSTLTRNNLDYWNITVGGKPFLVQRNWTNVQPQGCLIARN